MNWRRYVRRTPWDCKALGIPAYELVRVSRAALEVTRNISGHLTAKVAPLSSKELLHRYGFYYCDTLIQPYADKSSFRFFGHPDAGIIHRPPLAALRAVARNAFVYARFSRDFNLTRRQSETRYCQWLTELYDKKNVFGLLWKGRIAGFWGFSGDKILLHALSNAYRGRGLAKYLFSLACAELFGRGCRKLSSSISAANLAALNLYASLGFSFRNPCDVYHRLRQ